MSKTTLLSAATVAATTTTKAALLLRIHVRPNAKSNAVRECRSTDDIRIDIAADAQDGRANHELVDYLRSILKLAANQFEIIHGHKQRDKVVCVSVPMEYQQELIERLRKEIISK